MMITHLVGVARNAVLVGVLVTLGLSQGVAAGDETTSGLTRQGQGVPLLTVSGQITVPGGSTQLTLDRAALVDLPAVTFQTSTIWTDGVHSFTGVALVDLMDVLGVEDGTLVATAVNDYAVEIPVSDAVEGGPIVAYLMDGAEMTIRDKGPLWVIYPYDSNADYRTEVIYSRSIWQLDRLEIVQ